GWSARYAYSPKETKNEDWISSCGPARIDSGCAGIRPEACRRPFGAPSRNRGEIHANVGGRSAQGRQGGKQNHAEARPDTGYRHAGDDDGVRGEGPGNACEAEGRRQGEIRGAENREHLHRGPDRARSVTRFDTGQVPGRRMPLPTA